MKSAVFAEAEDATLPSSDDENTLDDEDTIGAFELEQSFQLKYKIADESAVTLKKDYILSLCQDSAFTRVAAGLSNGAVQVFDITQQRGLQYTCVDCIPAPAAVTGPEEQPVNICGVRFLDETPNCLLVGTTNGLVRLFDLRTQKEQARFVDTSSVEDDNRPAVSKGITSFDRNANGRILCAGTDQFQHNVYLLFYDVRERKQLGGYYESHEDDVTTVRFHGQNPDLLCTGSTDGLINVFNIKETTEDDALMTTINTECSVHKLNWHKNVYEKDIISCITHTNDFYLYECEEGDVAAQFGRSKVTAAMKRKNEANCNLIDAHNMTDGNVFLLAGTNANKGEIMRSLRVQNKDLLPLANFDGNKQIVRESVFDPSSGAVITAGECGIVSLWTPHSTAQAATSDATKLKAKSKPTTKKSTPY